MLHSSAKRSPKFIKIQISRQIFTNSRKTNFWHIVTPWRRDMEHHLKKCVILGWFYTRMKKKPSLHFLCKNQDFWTLTHHNLSKKWSKMQNFLFWRNFKPKRKKIWNMIHPSCIILNLLQICRKKNRFSIFSAAG